MSHKKTHELVTNQIFLWYTTLKTSLVTWCVNCYPSYGINYLRNERSFMLVFYLYYYYYLESEIKGFRMKTWKQNFDFATQRKGQITRSGTRDKMGKVAKHMTMQGERQVVMNQWFLCTHPKKQNTLYNYWPLSK